MAVNAHKPEEYGFAGKKNIYVCDTCKGHIVTVDLVNGTTPFMTNCRATRDCKGIMRSSGYRVFDQSMKAEWEWYKPTAEEVAEATPVVKEHVRMGGLLLRRIKGLFNPRFSQAELIALDVYLEQTSFNIDLEPLRKSMIEELKEVLPQD